MQKIIILISFALNILIGNFAQANTDCTNPEGCSTLEFIIKPSDLSLAKTGPVQPTTYTEWIVPLPELVMDSAFSMMYGPVNGVFGFKVPYSLEQAGNSLGQFIIYMTQQRCTIDDTNVIRMGDYEIISEVTPVNSSNIYCNITVNSPLISQTIINIYNQTNNYLNLEDNTSQYAAWKPLPAQQIAANTQTQGILAQDSSDNAMSGSVTYAATDFCTDIACDPFYQFTLNFAERECTATSGGFFVLQVTSSEEVLGSVVCEANISIAPTAGSPQMNIVVNNQFGTLPGSELYSYALLNQETQVEQGLFLNMPSDLEVNQNQQIVLSGWNGLGSFYQGTIFYLFDDLPMNTVPTGLQIEVDNTVGNDISKWCQAGITGWNGGYRLYQVDAQVSGNVTEATCTINITSVNNPQRPATYAFAQIDALPTEGIRQWEAFTINNQTYLAAANTASKNSEYINHNVFRLDKNTNKFTALNNLLVGYRCVDSSYNEMLKDHAYSWKHFQVEGSDHLIMANYYTHPWKSGSTQQCDPNQTNYATESYIYDWTGSDFNTEAGCCDSLKTDSAVMWEFYTHRGQTYLAAAQDGLAGQSGVSIYQWSNGVFIKMNQPNLRLSSNRYSETFTVNSETYVLFSTGKINQEVSVYQVQADGQLTLYQHTEVTPNTTIAPEGWAQQTQVLQINGETFLVLGYASGRNANNASYLYRWEYSSLSQRNVFVPYQNLPASTNNIKSWGKYQLNDKVFIAGALGNQGVLAYQWNNSLQQMETQYTYPIWPTGDTIENIEVFVVDDTPYMALAMTQDKNQNVQIRSPILKWQQVEK
jgi:hypothetical protein